MANEQATGARNLKQKHDTVGERLAVLKIEFPITVLVERACPLPTCPELRHMSGRRSVLVDLRPKTRDRFFVHWN
jgi:hypothetical protein